VSQEILILDVKGLKVMGGGFTVSGGGSSRIFYVNNAGTELSLTNLILTNGYATGTSYAGAFGGAMFIGTGVTLAMTGCTFLNNVVVNGYGGALNLGRDSGTIDLNVTITSCTFTGNSVATSGVGGGLFIGTGVTLAMSDCTFTSNNGGSYGGGICQYATSTASLTRVAFTSNSVTTYGGGYYMNGAATCVTTLTSCTFTSNTATTGGRGGGVSDIEYFCYLSPCFHDRPLCYPIFNRCTLQQTLW